MGCVYSRVCMGDISSPKTSKPAETQNAGNPAAVGTLSPSSSNGENREVGDQLNQLNANRESEAVIRRLSRVSSQFLPPEGSRTVKVPTGNYELCYSFLSQRGYYPDALDKANQDSFCIHTPFGTNPNDHFFGVFDGHGEFGAQCSQYAKRKICENLLRNSKFQTDAVEACHAAFLATNSQLHADLLDDSMSGTTAVTIFVRGRKIYVSNSGDSRAVLAEKRGEDTVALDLSSDHTPFRTDEVERVKHCGARVLTLDQIEGLKDPDVQCWGAEEGDDGDPPRLWVPNGMYPGTAFTRSIGDSLAETIGVVATPEIVVFELTSNHPFFVLASDGVFEFLSSQTVIDMVAKFKDPRDACAAIVAESYRLWLQYETRTDDITVIVVHINGLTNTGVNESENNGGLIQSPSPSPVPQVVEVTGSESPSAFGWNSRNHRVRQDLSKARLRAIETSLENGQIWVPPSPAHRKTWEEEAHIERALHDHFLFRKLTDSQCHVLLDCMQRVEVQPGEIVVKQGGEGDCFYVVGSGEFEVLAAQQDKNGEVPRVLLHYTAEKLSSFGELALMSNKPLQASVRAVSSGTLWALKREDFRGILMSEFTNLSSLKLLRSINLLSRLTILQLSNIADSLSEVSFSDGQVIIDKRECLLALHIIQKGQVRITFGADFMNSPNIYSLKSGNYEEDETPQSSEEISLVKSEGNYFGEWALLGEHIQSFTAIAVGDVVCAVLTKENFDLVIGPLTKLPQDDQKITESASNFPKEPSKSIDVSALDDVGLSDLEWRTCLYANDCCEIGIVFLRSAELLLSLKRFSKHKVKKLGKEEQVLKEKNLLKSLSGSNFIPQILCTRVDQIHAGILLNTCLACPMSSILNTPLDESSSRFFAASLVIALEDLHQHGVIYRGISPDVIMLDQTGRIQLVDFRFGKMILGERTFTACGMADFLAPEIVQGKGHTFTADWWALGVLIYFMLKGEKPFGSWRENELDTYAKIAKGQLNLPQIFNPPVIDLISKLLEVEESSRLGAESSTSIKTHPWFDSLDWNGIRECSFPVPDSILSRITQHLDNRPEDSIPFLNQPHDPETDLDWIEGW